MNQTIASALIFLLVEIYFWSKRKSYNTIDHQVKYEKSFRIPAFLLIGSSLFQNYFSKVISPDWEQSSFLLFPLLVYLVIQIWTGINKGQNIFTLINSGNFRQFFFAVSLIIFVYLVFQMDFTYSKNTWRVQINDSIMAAFIFALYSIVIATFQFTVHENGLVYGFLLIHWSKFQSWKWNPQNPNHLILSTKSFLLPYIHIPVNYEQHADVEQILCDKAPQATCSQTARPYTIDPPQIPRNPYFDAPD